MAQTDEVPVQNKVSLSDRIAERRISDVGWDMGLDAKK